MAHRPPVVVAAPLRAPARARRLATPTTVTRHVTLMNTALVPAEAMVLQAATVTPHPAALPLHVDTPLLEALTPTVVPTTPASPYSARLPLRAPRGTRAAKGGLPASIAMPPAPMVPPPRPIPTPIPTLAPAAPAAAAAAAPRAAAQRCIPTAPACSLALAPALALVLAQVQVQA